MREVGLQSYGPGPRMEAQCWVPFSAEVAHPMPLSLSLPVAVTQGLQCHLCKGFGGCSHRFTCPWSSTHCVIIATRECGGRGGLDTPFLHRELAHGAGRAQSPCGAHKMKNREEKSLTTSAWDRDQSLGGGGGMTLSTVADMTEIWTA